MSHLLKATQVVGVLEFSAGQFDCSHGAAFTVLCCVVFFSDVKVRAVLLFCFELGLRLASDSLCSCRWLKLVISCLHLPILGFQVCGITSAVLGINPRLCACCASTSPAEPHPAPRPVWQLFWVRHLRTSSLHSLTPLGEPDLTGLEVLPYHSLVYYCRYFNFFLGNLCSSTKHKLVHVVLFALVHLGSGWFLMPSGG